MQSENIEAVESYYEVLISFQQNKRMRRSIAALDCMSTAIH